tara:strand:+ start:6732 stop:6965 length:234 start_codon:yes stop_codon:yes gene_type:complete
MNWKSFFESIAWLFENILFIPYESLRSLQLDSWWAANLVSWIFLLIGVIASIYWIYELRLSDKRGEERKDITAHTFL